MYHVYHMRLKQERVVHSTRLRWLASAMTGRSLDLATIVRTYTVYERAVESL